MQIFDILGLNSIECQILETATIPMLQINIARKIGSARTALYPHLENLIKRGLVKTKQKGKRTVYVAKTEIDIRNTIFESLLEINKEAAISLPGVDVYIGKKALREIWLILGNQPRHSRVQALQPTRALSLALQKVPLKISRENHALYIKNKIIVEQLGEEDVYGYVKDFLVSMDQLKEVQSDFEERTTSTTIFPKDTFRSQSELFLLNDSVLLIDWKKEIAVRLYSVSTVELFKKLFEFSKSYGKLVDNVAEVKRRWD